MKFNNDTTLRFKLRLNVDEWGKYKKGDIDIFYIKLLNDKNGLVRFPIDDRWDILSCEIELCAVCKSDEGVEFLTITDCYLCQKCQDNLSDGFEQSMLNYKEYE